MAVYFPGNSEIMVTWQLLYVGNGLLVVHENTAYEFVWPSDPFLYLSWSSSGVALVESSQWHYINQFYEDLILLNTILLKLSPNQDVSS